MERVNRSAPGGIAAALALLLAAGCADDLRPNDPDLGAGDLGAFTGDGVPPRTGNFTHAVVDGVVRTVVDATDDDAWQHLDLDDGFAVGASDGWELAFSRFRVRINGGVSGDGGVRVAVLDGEDFAAVTSAPESGWTVPVPDGDADDDAEPDNVFNDGEDDWYAYDPATHTLTAVQPRTYVVATTDGRFVKLAFDRYYDDAGSPAFVSFRWAAVQAPDGGLPDAGPPLDIDGGPPDPDAGVEPLPSHAVTIDAADPEAWVHVSVAGGVVTVADPDSDLGWDLALRRTDMRTNGGSSGPGWGGARLDGSGLAYDDLTDSTTIGFAEDELVDSGRPGAEPSSANPVLSGWFDYDPVGHRVSAGDRTYVLRTSSGGYAKLRVWRWEDGVYALSLLPLERLVEVRRLEVDASDGEAWVAVSLRDGAIVEVAEAAVDLTWDVAFSRTRVRTNGGTAGSGLGEAVEVEAATLDVLGEAPTDGWAADESLTSGAPGSPAYDGNPVLGGWFAYDPIAHAVSPRDVSFVVRTADGHLGALRVISYADGVLTLDVAFAGPGQSTFF